MADDEFKHDSVQDRESIARYLRALLDGFEKGHISLGAEGQTLELTPQGLLEFEVRAKRKGGRSKVALKFTWREDEAGGNDDLTIKASDK